MSAVVHPTSTTRHLSVRVPGARLLGTVSLALFALAFAAALAHGHTQLAWWAVSGLFPLITPASLAMCVAATVQGIGSWSVAVVEAAAVLMGLAALLRAARHLDAL
jgi:hypothetical protein